MKKLLIFFGILLSLYYAQAQDTTEINIKDYVYSLEQKQKEIEEGLANLQAGLENFEKKIDERQTEINVWEDSIKILSVKIGNGDSSEIYEIKIDSLEKLISINKEIIEALNEGIEDITESIVELNESLEAVSDSYYFDIEMDTEANEHRRKKFSGHWASLQLGVNSFVSPDYSLNLPAESNYMTTDPLRSREFAINPLQFSIPFFCKYIGAVTGLGFRFNNYELAQNIKLTTNEKQEIVAAVDTENTYIKNIFKTAKITVPLLIEFQIPVSKIDKRIYLSAGLLGSYTFNKKMKYVYYGTYGKIKYKDKNKTFPTTQFRYEATARIGFDNFYVYANYDFMPLFYKGAGAEIYPVSAGIGLTFK